MSDKHKVFLRTYLFGVGLTVVEAMAPRCSDGILDLAEALRGGVNPLTPPGLEAWSCHWDTLPQAD